MYFRPFDFNWENGLFTPHHHNPLLASEKLDVHDKRNITLVYNENIKNLSLIFI